ncbi:YfiR/HmsC family protein [bacterium]|nr:YfiR/HmsC family protein [bacterium]NUN45982.1 YfiR family protein [bacterium]
MKTSYTFDIFVLVILLAGLLSVHNPAHSQDEEIPNEILAPLIVKVLHYERRLSIDRSLTIFVLLQPKLGEKLKAYEGKKVGTSTIVTVTFGTTLPFNPPDVIYIGDVQDPKAVFEYANKNKIMTIAKRLTIIESGASLGIIPGNDNKPKIIVNLNSSSLQGITWNAAIFKVAQVIK